MITDLLAVQSLKMFPTSEGAQILLNNNFAAHSITRVIHDGKYVVSESLDDTARSRSYDP